MKGESGLLLLILLPMIGGLICRFLAGREEDNQRRMRASELVFAAVSPLTLGLAAFYAFRPVDGIPALAVSKICGKGMTFSMTGFRTVYVLVALIAWTVSCLFALWYMHGEENRGRYFCYTLVTLGSTLGVFLSADLYTTFFFFEMMSLASYVWVVQEENREAVRASKTYLAVAVIGGLVMLMGIFLLAHGAGTLDTDRVAAYIRAGKERTEIRAAVLCLLFGFGAKAGAFPLHIWLPKAHPVAPAPASALLSGILTKAGMFGVLLITGQFLVGDEAFGRFLMVIAVCTMLVGAVIALFSVDIKHILACSSVSQIGFMLCGAAALCILKEEQWLAVSGTVLHMLNHSFFKLLLFLLAGVAVHDLKSRDLNVLRGFGAGKPWLMLLFMSGAFGIAGVPGFSGFVSKSMIHESLVLCYKETGEMSFRVTEILFLIAGGCTAAYMLKLFIVLFFKKPSKDVEAFNRSGVPYLSKFCRILLSIPALLIYLAGTLPEYIMFPVSNRASDITVFGVPEEAFRVFTAENFKGGLISLCIGAALWFLVVNPLITKRVAKNETVYVNRFPKKLDLENGLYRPVLLKLLPGLLGGFCRFAETVTEKVSLGIYLFGKQICGLADRIPELCITGVRRTALRPVCEKTTVSTARRISIITGTFLNGVSALFARLFKKKAKGTDNVERIYRGLNDMSETAKLVTRSLSYGLLAFCAGLLAMLVYLLYCLQG